MSDNITSAVHWVHECNRKKNIWPADGLAIFLGYRSTAARDALRLSTYVGCIPGL